MKRTSLLFRICYRNLLLSAACLLLHQSVLIGQVSSVKFLGSHSNLELDELKLIDHRTNKEFMPSCSHTKHFRLDYSSHKRHSGTLDISLSNDSLKVLWEARVYQVEGVKLNGIPFEIDSTIVKLFPIHDTVSPILVPLIEYLLDCVGDSCYNSKDNKSFCLHGDGIVLESVVDGEYTLRSFTGCLSYAHTQTPKVRELFSFFRNYEGFQSADRELHSILEPGAYTNGYWYWHVPVTEPFLRFDKIGRPASLE